MSAPSARARSAAASAVFDETPRRSGLITLAIHGALFGALALMSRHPRARELARAASVVEFDTPPQRPPPPPPPEPPAAEAPPPPPPEHHRVRVPVPTPATPAPAPEPPPAAAPPPILTAEGNTGAPGDSVPTGTNTNYRGGDTASTGRGNEGGHGERTTQEATPAPTVPSGPVDLPDEATAPEPMDGNEQPEYPESLREAGVQGTVIARFVVRADGSVGDVRIVRGPEDLHDAVREALRRWRFRPATVNGHAISVYRTMPFRFVLDNL
jgi:protein TonB